MKMFNKAERESATISITFNYKPTNGKEVVTHPHSIRLKDITDEEYNILMDVMRKGYKSRKLKTQIKKSNTPSCTVCGYPVYDETRAFIDKVAGYTLYTHYGCHAGYKLKTKQRNKNGKSKERSRRNS
jgi:hypothetical protein